MSQVFMSKLFSPLRYRDFRLLWIGQTISALGNPFQTIAITWLVLQLTGSILNVATVLLALNIPQACMVPVGGIITDRLDARTVMLWCDGVRTLTAGAIALLALLGWLPIWLLCLILIMHGTANGIFSPASNSITPRLVPEGVLSSANSLTEAISQLGTFVGALPAGLLVAVGGPALACGVNALSFGIATLSAIFMRPLAVEARTEKQSLLKDGLQGVQYLRHVPWLIGILLMDTCAGIAAIGPITLGLPLLARSHFAGGAETYSLLLWSFGVGSVIGMFLPAFYAPKRHRGLIACIIQLIEVPLLALLAFGSLPVVIGSLIAISILNSYLLILELTLIQGNVNKSMLGRIMSIFLLGSFGFIPLSYTATGLIANYYGLEAVFLTAAGITLLGVVIGLLIPSLRRLD